MALSHLNRTGAPEIAALLRQDIQSGVLQDKQRLPAERALAENYNVARGTVREALHLLVAEGLVTVRPGSGTYVAAPPVPELNPILQNGGPLELIDARFALEPHICRLAVLHATPEDFRQAEDLLVRMEASEHDPIAFSDADTLFHTLLVESTGNAILIWIIAQINLVRNQEQWSHMRNITLNPETIRHYNKQHRLLLDAIRARQPERAATLMKGHLETARLSLTRAAAT